MAKRKLDTVSKSDRKSGLWIRTFVCLDCGAQREGLGGKPEKVSRDRDHRKVCVGVCGVRGAVITKHREITRINGTDTLSDFTFKIFRTEKKPV